MDGVEGLRMLFVTFSAGVGLISSPNQANYTFADRRGQIVGLDTTAALQKRFIAYGPRLGSNAQSSSSLSKGGKSESSIVSKILDAIASLTVSHQWFYHFYLLSVCLSFFWVVQLFYPTRILETVLLYAAKPERRSMLPEQVALLWLMMLIQGSRRLYECLAFDKPSASRMWVGHWALGLAFYLAMSIAVWIEGAGEIRNGAVPHMLVIRTPSLKTFIAVPIFLMASGLQHDCHRYLADLRKYSLPSHPAFQRLIAPHYFAECLIYASFTLAGAPPRTFVNRTLLTAFAFVVINLGITSYHSKRWYAQKFGQEQIAHKWNMVPYVF